MGEILRRERASGELGRRSSDGHGVRWLRRRSPALIVHPQAGLFRDSRSAISAAHSSPAWPRRSAPGPAGRVCSEDQPAGPPARFAASRTTYSLAEEDPSREAGGTRDLVLYQIESLVTPVPRCPGRVRWSSSPAVRPLEAGRCGSRSRCPAPILPNCTRPLCLTIPRPWRVPGRYPLADVLGGAELVRRG
jgi:hypothetical protein